MAELPGENITDDMRMDENELIAEVRREFSSGLPNRLQTMRSALASLAQGFELEAADVFYRSAHSLKGTALSFDGNELADHAALLAELGHRWVKGRAVAADEMAKAIQELERLSAAVESYRMRVEGAV